jgi:integrase
MNSTLSLVRYAKLENGWRRGKIVKQANGKIKHPFMLVGGKETDAPQGTYQIIQYDGSRPVYTDLGNDPMDAMSRFKAEEKKAEKRVDAIKAAEKAGLKIELEQPADEKAKTLTSLATDFLEMHRNLPHRSNDSLSRYTLVTRTFLSQCKAKYPAQVTVDDVSRWAGHIQRELHYADRGRSNMYVSLRTFLQYCEVDLTKLIDKGTHKLLIAYVKKIPDMYTPEQVSALMDAALDEQEALMWNFAYRTGVRDSELKMITRDDLHGLNTKAPMLHVTERDEYSQIKTGEERKIELHSTLVPQLKKWLADNPKRVLLFGTENDETDDHILRTLKRTAHRAKLNCGRCKGCAKFGRKTDSGCSQYTLHKFRRTYISRMLKAFQGDYRAVMLRSGHKTVESLMRYLAPSEVGRDALEAAF